MAKQQTPKKTTAKPVSKPAAKVTTKPVNKDSMNTGVKFFDNYINETRKRVEKGDNIYPFKKGGSVKSKMKTGGATKAKKK